MEHIRVEIEGGVGLLTIDRPERMSSFDVETARQFRKAGLGLSRDGMVRAVVLRGSPGAFCTGADLKYVRAGGEASDLGYLQPSAHEIPQSHGEVFKQILEYLHSAISEIRRSPKPWLAAVDGVAAAGGLGIAMACDLVFASERASFEWAYGKTGLTGAESVTFFLPRLLGLRRAFGLVFLNPRLDARAALELGLVNRVLPVEGFDAEVRAVARRLAQGPTEAYGITKALMNDAVDGDRLDVHLDRELEELARIADGADFAEGLDAFLGKRPARFGGR